MESTPLWQTILSYIIPLISIFLSYLFGHMQATKNNKTSAKREQYDKFYVQYTSRIYTDRMWEKCCSDMPFASRSIYWDLIMNNIQYIDADIVKLLPAFYHTYECALSFKNDMDAKKCLDNDFNFLTKQILSRTSKLSKELQLPDFAEVALKLYSQFTRRG